MGERTAADASVAAERDALRRELAATRASRDEARSTVTDLCNAIDRRQHAEQKLAQLERERRDLAMASAPSRMVHCGRSGAGAARPSEGTGAPENEELEREVAEAEAKLTPPQRAIADARLAEHNPIKPLH